MPTTSKNTECVSSTTIGDPQVQSIVKKIIKKNVVGTNVYYLVKWANCDDDAMMSSWELRENLDCMKLITEFEDNLKRKEQPNCGPIHTLSDDSLSESDGNLYKITHPIRIKTEICSENDDNEEFINDDNIAHEFEVEEECDIKEEMDIEEEFEVEEECDIKEEYDEEECDIKEECDEESDEEECEEEECDEEEIDEEETDIEEEIADKDAGGGDDQKEQKIEMYNGHREEIADRDAGGGDDQKVQKIEMYHGHREEDVKEIFGASILEDGLIFLIRFKNNDSELIPAGIANLLCPQAVIAFYEPRLKYTPPPKKVKKKKNLKKKQYLVMKKKITINDEV